MERPSYNEVFFVQVSQQHSFAARFDQLNVQLADLEARLKVRLVRPHYVIYT